MSCELSLYTDRALLSSLPEELRSQLRSQYLISGDEIRVSFCGVVMGSSGVHVFLPRNSSVPDAGSREGYRAASLLMRAVNRYTQDRSSKLYSLDEGMECIGSRRLSLVSMLLEDFCNNGIYSRRLSESVMNAGKPDWKRTIASQMPFPGAGGPVYLDVHGSRRRYVSDCEVARIHAEIIRDLDRSFGWLITGSDAPVSSGIVNIPPPKGNIVAKLRAVSNELLSVYSDREIRLLNMLSEYLRCVRGREASSSVIGVRHFHGMWEHMLDRTLLWSFPVNQLLAVPAYRFSDGSIRNAASKGQRTDTVLRHPGTDIYAVVDAKYYGAQGLESAPGWPDLVKQFFYAKALEVYSPGARVNNAFVFPGNGPLKSAHMRDRSTNETEDSHYPPIRCLYVEPLFLLEHYVNGRKLEQMSRELLGVE